MDNRWPVSLDSRYYGPVPLALVRGKIVARADCKRSWTGFSWVKNPFKNNCNKSGRAREVEGTR